MSTPEHDAIAAFNALALREDWEQQCDPTLAFVHRDFPVVLDIWTEQKKGRSMPARGDLTPRVLKGFLPRVAINERVSENPPRFTWRLMGTHITQVLGERTGKFVEENASPRQAARWQASLDLALTVGSPLRFFGRVLVNNKTYLSSELLFMPMTDDTGAPRFVLGFAHYTPEIAERAQTPEARLNA